MIAVAIGNSTGFLTSTGLSLATELNRAAEMSVIGRHCTVRPEREG